MLSPECLKIAAESSGLFSATYLQKAEVTQGGAEKW
jgi:hypothetical protein